MNLHAVKDVAFNVVVSCALLHTVLPPWDGDAIAQFPTLQKYYRLFVYIVGYVGLHARSLVYRSISTSDGTKVSDIAANGKPANG